MSGFRIKIKELIEFYNEKHPEATWIGLGVSFIRYDNAGEPKQLNEEDYIDLQEEDFRAQQIREPYDVFRINLNEFSRCALTKDGNLFTAPIRSDDTVDWIMFLNRRFSKNYPPYAKKAMRKYVERQEKKYGSLIAKAQERIDYFSDLKSKYEMTKTKNLSSAENACQALGIKFPKFEEKIRE